MFRTPLAVCVALLLAPFPGFAKSGRTNQKQHDRVVQVLRTTASGTYLRLKLMSGEKLEGTLIHDEPETILLNLQTRQHALPHRSIDIKDIREIKLGYGPGRRFKERMGTIAFFAVLIPAFTVQALLGKNTCLFLCD